MPNRPPNLRWISNILPKRASWFATATGELLPPWLKQFAKQNTRTSPLESAPRSAQIFSSIDKHLTRSSLTGGVYLKGRGERRQRQPFAPAVLCSNFSFNFSGLGW